MHEEKSQQKENAEVSIENIRIDKITKEYVTEIKKSDADIEAAKWQLLYYLKVLKEKGIIRKGRLQCIERNKNEKTTEIYELTDKVEEQLNLYISDIEKLLKQDKMPDILNSSKCKKCAYFEYCYI